MRQVTPQRKANGSELKGSLDELKQEADECYGEFFSKPGVKVQFFTDRSIHPRKMTIHTEK
jgi:hypothetical protein